MVCMLKHPAIIYGLFVIFLCGAAVPCRAQDFFDDFQGSSLDTTAWKVANQVWGNVPHEITNGGVVPQNVWVQQGNLVIEAHGNQYTGPVQGFEQNTRVGGAVYTAQPFGSGRFEVRAKICPHPGALSAFWTYYFENDDYNHEIDFEMPGHNKPPYGGADSDLRYGLLTSWRGIDTAHYHTFDTYFGHQVDGQYHLYRFEWHTGGAGEAPRVDWYYDDTLLASNVTPSQIPTHVTSFWLGVWFPTWVAAADFDTAYMYIDWVRITPYHEANDEVRTPSTGH